MTTWQDFVEFDPGQLLGSADANLIQTNIEFLRTPARYFYQRDFGDANYTTVGTTFANIDSTNMNIELETFGNPVRIEFHARVTNSTTGFLYFEISIDGAPLSNGAANGLGGVRGDVVHNIDISRLVPLSADVHTIAMQWRVTAGTGTIVVESNVQFEVHEEY